MESVVLDLRPVVRLTDADFYAICERNPDLNLELTAEGELIIVSPVGGESGNREARLIFALESWNVESRLGLVFSSSTIFRLPNTAFRSPDAAWVRQERWDALTPEEQRRFPPIAPDFVIELRSETDRLKPLQEKMREYIACGVRLGWLIDPQGRQVEVYRPDQDEEAVAYPARLSGGDVLSGFVLELA